jgi:hypothetical protein
MCHLQGASHVFVSYLKAETFLLSSNKRGHKQLPEDGTWMPKQIYDALNLKTMHMMTATAPFTE